MRPLYTDWEHVNGVVGALTDLRPLILDNPKRLELFDDLLDHDEWGVAFSVILDHLVEPSTPPASPEALKLVDYLTHKMKLEAEEAAKLATLRAKSTHGIHVPPRN